MAIKIAINGYGRIGRNILRALYNSPYQDEIKIVAINDVGSTDCNIHLTQYDTTFGKFSGEVRQEGTDMVVNGDSIRMCSDRDPGRLPWKDCEVDVVFECTGHLASREKSTPHLTAGAKKVIISAPGGKDVDATVVYGVNHDILSSEHTIISNASCTTNCLAPLVKPLHEKLGLEHGLMTTIHAFTNDQTLLDKNHTDIRRARAAGHNMIPTKTGAAAAVGLVLPELAGKLDGYAVRVPTMNVSLVDLSFQAARNTTVLEVNEILKTASENNLNGILAYNTLPLVSSDFNMNPASSIVDATQTKVIENFVKVVAWYDNEWGFSNRMLDVTMALMNAK